MIPANRTFFIGDNLPIMRDMDSECIDLIYIDPPFNSNANYSAPTHTAKTTGRKRQFNDIWTFDDIDEGQYNEIQKARPMVARVIDAANVGGESFSAYCVFMAVRLIEMHRILKPTGSIYLHCDTTAAHYLKMVMDGIFGRQNYMNDFIWLYEGRELSKTAYNKKHDTLLFYKASKKSKFNWEAIATPLKASSKKALERFVDEKGQPYLLRYKVGGGFAPIEKEGSEEVYRQYPKNKVPPRDWVKIDYARKSERLGSPTQKPLELLHHILKASSDENDLVFDAFAGCGTACVAAEMLKRRWVGIDCDPPAEKKLKDHLLKNHGRNPRVNFDKSYIGTIKEKQETAQPERKRQPIPQEIKQNLYDKQNGDCNGCEKDFELRNLNADHIRAFKLGGSDDESNLQLLCQSCNSIKGMNSQEYLKMILRQRGILK